MSSRTVILIGGAPTVGKSTLAKALSAHLGLPWISTDQIRTLMRAAARAEDFPHLFNSTGYTAEQFLTTYSAAEIARMEREQGEDTWKGIKAFVEGDYTWRQGFIVEGVNVLPHLAARDFGQNSDVKCLFLVDDDVARTRHVVYTRGLWDDAHTYSDDVKDKEVEWALLFGQHLRRDAQQHGYPVLDVYKNQDDLAAALKALQL